MPEIIFEFKWLKAEQNVKAGDIITFMDTGNQDEKKQWLFQVRIERTGEIKTFPLNKTNHTKISSLYGTNSDNWIGKQMKVRIVLVQNQKGEEVSGIRLAPPNTDLNAPTVQEDSPEDIIDIPF